MSPRVWSGQAAGDGDGETGPVGQKRSCQNGASCNHTQPGDGSRQSLDLFVLQSSRLYKDGGCSRTCRPVVSVKHSNVHETINPSVGHELLPQLWFYKFPLYSLARTLPLRSALDMA